MNRSENPIPDEVQRHILEDCEAGSDLDSIVHAALCYFTGFGCSKNYDLGLKRITRAALAGDLRARAVFLKLYQACGKEIPEDLPISEWLEMATIWGSHIASRELLQLDHERHARATRRSLNYRPNRPTARSFFDETAIADVRLVFNASDDSKLADTIRELLSSLPDQASRSIEDIEYRAWPMLHFAATFGHASMLRKLLELGARVNYQNFLGETALLCACRSGRLACAEILLDNGADSSIADKITGSTPLHYMIFMDEKDIPYISSRLVANGANVGAKSIPYPVLQQFIGEPGNYSDTPLHWAVSAGRFDLCQNLLQLGANPLEPKSQSRLGTLQEMKLGWLSTSKTW